MSRPRSSTESPGIASKHRIDYRGGGVAEEAGGEGTASEQMEELGAIGANHLGGGGVPGVPPEEAGNAREEETQHCGREGVGVDDDDDDDDDDALS